MICERCGDPDVEMLRVTRIGRVISALLCIECTRLWDVCCLGTEWWLEYCAAGAEAECARRIGPRVDVAACVAQEIRAAELVQRMALAWLAGEGA